MLQEGGHSSLWRGSKGPVWWTIFEREESRISNACWSEQVGEAGACWTTPSVAVSIGSAAGGGTISAFAGERLKVEGTGHSV